MISKLMQGSQDCLFPCWWGIAPGKSPWAYTNGLLAYLNLKSSSIELSEGRSYASVFASNGDFVYGIVSFTVSSNIVEDIKIHGVEESDPNFANRWAHYSLTEILKTYGLHLGSGQFSLMEEKPEIQGIPTTFWSSMMR